MNPPPNEYQQRFDDLGSVYDLEKDRKTVAPRGLLGSLALLVTRDESKIGRWQQAFAQRKATWKAKWEGLKQQRRKERDDRRYRGSLDEIEDAMHYPDEQHNAPAQTQPRPDWATIDTKPQPIVEHNAPQPNHAEPVEKPYPAQVNLANTTDPEVDTLALESIRRARQNLATDPPTIQMRVVRPRHHGKQDTHQ